MSKTKAILFSFSIMVVLSQMIPSSAIAQFSTLPVLNGNLNPTSLAYYIWDQNNYDATHCEFYVDSFAKGTQYEYHSCGHSFIEADFVVNRPQMETNKTWILNVGAYVKWHASHDETGEKDEEALILANPVRGQLGTYRWTFKTSGSCFGVAYSNKIEQLAFFVDLLRPTETVRLWIKDGAQDFTLEKIFDSYPLYRVDGARSYQYVDYKSPVFNQRRTCK